LEVLHDAYRHQAKGEVRTRLQALWLLRQGWRLEAVAAAVGVHYRTVQRWVRWYRVGGLAEVWRQHLGGTGQAPYLTPEQDAAVRAEVATGRCHTAAEVRQWIEEQFGVTYTATGISSLLQRLKARPKVPRPIHAKADQAVQEAWKRGAVPRPSRRPA
jgi:transposase